MMKVLLKAALADFIKVETACTLIDHGRHGLIRIAFIHMVGSH